MKRNKWVRFLTAILSVILCVGMLPISVFADKVECRECGHEHYEGSDWICDGCGCCSAECENTSCWEENHCNDCGACIVSLDGYKEMCMNCMLCHDCWDSGEHCINCGACSSDAGDICEHCKMCENCVDSHCSVDGCDSCEFGDEFCEECKDEEGALICVKCCFDNGTRCLICEEHCYNEDWCFEHGVSSHHEDCVDDEDICIECGACRYEDEDICPDCGCCTLNGCQELYHCIECGECTEGNATLCQEYFDEYGEAMCEECAEEEGINSCPDCGNFLSEDMKCEVYGTHCTDCCIFCEECGWCTYYDNYCEECGRCDENYCMWFYHCWNCTQCFYGREEELCHDYVEYVSGKEWQILCIECATDQEYYCPECGKFIYEPCASGGNHCVNCCKICEECRVCHLEEDDLCPYCECCEDCYHEWHCVECDGCVCEKDFCEEYIKDTSEPMCKECAEKLGFYCDCGEYMWLTEGCGNDDERIHCLACCTALSEGYGCSHGVCVYSDEWESHYCKDHGICRDYCDHGEGMLPAPQSLRWEGGYIKWDAVPGAERYRISFYKDGKLLHRTTTHLTWDIKKWYMETLGYGSYTFTVVAMSENSELGKFSKMSPEYNYMDPKGKYNLTVINGEAVNGIYQYAPGETVTIRSAPPEGYRRFGLRNWNVESGIEPFEDDVSDEISFPMPERDLTVIDTVEKDYYAKNIRIEGKTLKWEVYWKDEVSKARLNMLFFLPAGIDPDDPDIFAKLKVETEMNMEVFPDENGDYSLDITEILEEFGEGTYNFYLQSFIVAHQYDDYDLNCPEVVYPPIEAATLRGTYKLGGEIGDKATVQLIKEGESEAAYEITVTGPSGIYTVEKVEAGTYTMRVSKKDATREYTVAVSGNGVVTQNIVMSLSGDANGDGKVNTTDAVLILRSIAKWSVANFDGSAADINGDGNVNTTDAILILRYLAGWELTFQIG